MSEDFNMPQVYGYNPGRNFKLSTGEEGEFPEEDLYYDCKIAGGSKYGMAIDHHGSQFYIQSDGKDLIFVMNYPKDND